MGQAATKRTIGDMATGASRRETVKLYDDAIAAVDQAIVAIAQDDIEARCAALCAATELITTLYLNRDFGRRGESSDELADLQSHILARLRGINLHNDPNIARNLIELLQCLRDSRTDPAAMMATSGSTADLFRAPPMPGRAGGGGELERI